MSVRSSLHSQVSQSSGYADAEHADDAIVEGEFGRIVENTNIGSTETLRDAGTDYSSSWRPPRQAVSSSPRRVSFEGGSPPRHDRYPHLHSTNQRPSSPSIVQSAPDAFDTELSPVGGRLNPILQATRETVAAIERGIIDEDDHDDDGYDEDGEDGLGNGGSVDEDEDEDGGHGGIDYRKSALDQAGDHTSDRDIHFQDECDGTDNRHNPDVLDSHGTNLFPDQYRFHNSREHQTNLSRHNQSSQMDSKDFAPSCADVCNTLGNNLSGSHRKSIMSDTTSANLRRQDLLEGADSLSRFRHLRSVSAVPIIDDQEISNRSDLDERSALLQLRYAQSPPPPVRHALAATDRSDSPDDLFQSYGGMDRTFVGLEQGPLEGGRPPPQFYDPHFDHQSISRNHEIYLDGGGSQEQLFMDTRADDFPLYEEDDHKAAFIIGTGSLAVFTVVVAVIISGLTALLGVDVEAKFEVLSDWKHGEPIPVKYGCFAEGGQQNAMSIPLQWANIPPQASSLVVLVANPGAIEKNGTDPVHWFLTNVSVTESMLRNEVLPSSAKASLDKMHQYRSNEWKYSRNPSSIAHIWSIPPNASRDITVFPSGINQRPNSGGDTGLWYPLCAPPNTMSLYIVYVYAVDATPVIADYRDARQIMNRFSGVPLAKLAGFYGHAPGKRGRTST